MNPSRIVRLFAAVALGLGLVLGFTMSASASSGSGWIRLAHLSPNTPAVDVYLYSFGDSNAEIVLHHVSYGTVSPYERVASGEYTVAMRAAGASAGSAPVLSTTVTVATGHAYTVAGMGPASGLRLQIMRDALTTPKGKVLVRVIQASLAEQKVTITAGSKVLASNLAFAKVTPYRTVSPGTWTVKADGGSESTSTSISLAAGTIHTIVVLDDPGHLKLVDLTDAAGSKVLPDGGAATGLGGTAPEPGAPLLPWILVGSAGLLVTSASAVRLRRSRVRAVRAH